MLDLITLLAAPAAALMLALPFGMHLRTTAEDRQMRAVYLFHRTGEPIAMVAPDHAPPFAPEQLEPIISTVRDFVETSMPKSQGYDVTSMRFDEEALVAVRGAPRQRVRRVPQRDHAADPPCLRRIIPGLQDSDQRPLPTLESAVPVGRGAGR